MSHGWTTAGKLFEMYMPKLHAHGVERGQAFWLVMIAFEGHRRVSASGENVGAKPSGMPKVSTSILSESAKDSAC